MNMKRKSYAVLLVLCMVLLLAACQNDAPAPEDMTESNATEVTTEATEATTEAATEGTEEAVEETESTEAAGPKTMAGTMTMNFDLSAHESENPVRLWIPYAASDEFQTISNANYTVADEANTKAELTKDELGNEILYVEFAPEAKEKKVTYTFDLERKEVLRPEFKEETDFDPAEFEEYLQGTTMVKIDGEVKELADEITQGKETVYDKTQAIYNWIYDNMERNEDVVGCGLGNVSVLLVTLNGKCTDIHSVFIALARAAGVPARETFGVRLSNDPEADVTKNQHCWAEYYQPGTGWVAIDIADVLRGILKQDLEKDSQEALDLKEYYWGNMDPVRVGFSVGRDLTLNPAQEGAPLNTFGYPYAEVDGNALDFYAPDSFIYQFSYKNAQ